MNITADEFNVKFPIGTTVCYWPVLPRQANTQPRETRTRSRAWELAGTHTVVMIEGLAGCVSLLHLEPLEALPVPVFSAEPSRRAASQGSKQIRCPYCGHVQDWDSLDLLSYGLITYWGEVTGRETDENITKVHCQDCDRAFRVREKVIRTFDVVKGHEEF